ncbi:MAG: hypothetical protein V1867_04235 [Candidatus Falkowbacteria bacterium]
MPKVDKKNQQTGFIDFLNQSFSDREKNTSYPGRIIAERKNNQSRPPADPERDKKIRAFLAATLPVKNDKLKLVLDKKLPDTDIEGCLVEEWSRRAVSFERLLSGSERKNPEGSVRGPASRKNGRHAKQKIETRISASRLSGLLIFGLIALLFSFVSVGFAPGSARSITDKLDKLIVYPIISIAKRTSPDAREFYADVKVSRPAITKGILAAYIIKNRPQAAAYPDVGPRTIVVTEEDLRGRVAGIDEESIPANQALEQRTRSGGNSLWRKIFTGLAERLADLLPDKPDF